MDKLARVLLLINLIAWLTPACATNDFQIWSNVTATGKIKPSEKFRYWLESQGRFGEDASRLSQFLARPGVGYSVTPSLSVWLGYAWIYTTLPFSSPASDENRVWQQLLWNTHYSGVKFILRTRLEQRFISSSENTAWRFRQFIKVEKPLPHPRFSFITTEEVFIHLNNFNQQNNQGFDQNRFFVGLGYKIAEHTSLEGGYLNQAIRRVNTSDYSGNYLSMSLLFSH